MMHASLRSPHGDLTHRRPVWDALSVLFLDTELTEADIAASAMILARSPYTNEELAAIYHAEVAPVCESNIGMAPGFWAYFPDRWVEQAILSQGLDASQARADLQVEQSAWGWGDLQQRFLLLRAPSSEAPVYLES
jgi:hypothetical protein